MQRRLSIVENGRILRLLDQEAYPQPFATSVQKLANAVPPSVHHGCTKTVPKRLGGTPGKRSTPSKLKTLPERLDVCAWKTTQRRLAERLGAEALSPPNRLRNVLSRESF
ncbi:hypothetical protein PGT21_020489 [Puccinia graminis f. sp. tritici]|uniref:Uncharacterized protein n=1 Tax=Puccinia graminis f. sp. tritici TaxID=56615 RepID=A0A5B0PGG0_PUCGR|nr:hypothetical protein PGTUg99_031885 [Puccinia graminis f. sp. tritici]KAA1099790.1 hypothetical protein PGT21_020489 [Puccinia graminis f. sp. tritici]